MTTTSNTSALPAARPIYRATTLNSLVTAGLSDPPAMTFIRNDPSRRPQRSHRLQAGESPGEKGAPVTRTMAAPVMRAYPTAADWRKAADESVPQQVFSLVLGGSLSAAKSLMRAYGMSPDAKLGPLGLDEVLDRASAAPADIAKFRRFLVESRAAHPAAQPQPQPQAQAQAQSTGVAGERTAGAIPTPMPVPLSQVRRAHSAPAAGDRSGDDEPLPRRIADNVPGGRRSEPSPSPVRAPMSADMPARFDLLQSLEPLRAKTALPLIEEEPATPRMRTGSARTSNARRHESIVGSSPSMGTPPEHRGADDVHPSEDDARRSRMYAFKRHCLDPVATVASSAYTSTKRAIHEALYACFISYVPGRPSQIPRRHYVSGPGLRRGAGR